MSETKFDNPTQFENTEIMIDGEDVRGIFDSVSIFEDIYRPCITGNIVIRDSDGAGFIEQNDIEFIEPIKMRFKNANGDELEFEGVLNGLRNESILGSTKVYVVDFTSKSVRANEATYVTNSYKETAPEEIVKKMVEKLGGELKTKARGKQMNYIGSRKRPTDVIKYVLTHALTQETSATENKDSKKEQAKGTTGFLCWETLDGYKFESIKDVLSGKVGEKHEEFKLKLSNRSVPMDQAMKSIVQVEFKQIGDFQTKLRSGAFASKNISFDMDKGTYKEYTMFNKENMTEKQEKALTSIKVEGAPSGTETFTRVFSKPITNQKFTNTCDIAQPLTGDQSRGALQQNAGQQNTFADQTGAFTFYPQFKFKAGDLLDCEISKVKDEYSDGQSDKKHSGKYIMQAVAHHFFNDGKAYTKVKTIRSTIQQDEESSETAQKNWAKGQVGRDV